MHTPRISARWRRARKRYHIALAVTLALAPLAVEPVRGQAFVEAFLARWGEAMGKRNKRRHAKGPR
jgi:hypothetical protein